MMYASLHCTDCRKTRFAAEWRRKHGEEPVGTQDYFTVQVETDCGQVTLYLSPDQALEMAARLHTASQDRDVVLAEELLIWPPLELAGGG